MTARKTAPLPAGPPLPALGLTCRRCGGREHIYDPNTCRVRCVGCMALRAVAAMVRAARRTR